MNAVTNSSRYLPSFKPASPNQVLQNLTSLAIPIIVFVGLSHMQSAEAGFGFFTACMSICSAATGGTLIPACVAACVASLAAPTL